MSILDFRRSVPVAETGEELCIAHPYSSEKTSWTSNILITMRRRILSRKQLLQMLLVPICSSCLSIRMCWRKSIVAYIETAPNLKEAQTLIYGLGFFRFVQFRVASFADEPQRDLPISH